MTGSSAKSMQCVVCNSQLQYNYFYLTQPLLINGASLSSRLSTILTDHLDTWVPHSQVICTHCFHLLFRIDYLETLIQDMSSDVMKKYMLSCEQLGFQYRLKKNKNSSVFQDQTECSISGVQNLSVSAGSLMEYEQMETSSTAQHGQLIGEVRCHVTQVTETIPEGSATSVSSGTAMLGGNGSSSSSCVTTMIDCIQSSSPCASGWPNVGQSPMSYNNSQLLFLPDYLCLPEAHRPNTTSLLSTLPSEPFCLDYSVNPPGPINLTADILSSCDNVTPPPSNSNISSEQAIPLHSNGNNERSCTNEDNKKQEQQLSVAAQSLIAVAVSQLEQSVGDTTAGQVLNAAPSQSGDVASISAHNQCNIRTTTPQPSSVTMVSSSSVLNQPSLQAPITSTFSSKFQHRADASASFQRIDNPLLPLDEETDISLTNRIGVSISPTKYRTEEDASNQENGESSSRFDNVTQPILSAPTTRQGNPSSMSMEIINSDSGNIALRTVSFSESMMQGISHTLATDQIDSSSSAATAEILRQSPTIENTSSKHVQMVKDDRSNRSLSYHSATDILSSIPSPGSERASAGTSTVLSQSVPACVASRAISVGAASSAVGVGCARGTSCPVRCVLDVEWPQLEKDQRFRLGSYCDRNESEDTGIDGDFIRCFYCDQYGSLDLNALRCHVQSSHNPRLLIDCVLINDQHSRFKMGLHLSSVSGDRTAGRQFVCIFCDGVYKTERSLKNHFRELHTPNMRHKCVDCGEMFRREIDQARHKVYRCRYSRIHEKVHQQRIGGAKKKQQRRLKIKRAEQQQNVVAAYQEQQPNGKLDQQKQQQNYAYFSERQEQSGGHYDDKEALSNVQVNDGEQQYETAPSTRYHLQQHVQPVLFQPELQNSVSSCTNIPEIMSSDHRLNNLSILTHSIAANYHESGDTRYAASDCSWDLS